MKRFVILSFNCYVEILIATDVELLLIEINSWRAFTFALSSAVSSFNDWKFVQRFRVNKLMRIMIMIKK